MAQTMMLMPSSVAGHGGDLKRDPLLHFQIQGLRPKPFSHLLLPPLSTPRHLSTPSPKTLALFKSKTKATPSKLKQEPKPKVEDGIFGTSGGIGFTKENELFVGRVAMIGFAASLLGEGITGKGILAQLNIETGIPIYEAEPLLLFFILFTLLGAIGALGDRGRFVDEPTTGLENSDQENSVNSSKASLWSSFVASAFSVFETLDSSSGEKKAHNTRTHGWTTAVKRVVTGGSMRKLQECILGPGKTGICSSTSEIWLLGVRYKISQDDPSEDGINGTGLDAFEQDFSSRIWMTYRKGFDAIGDSKFTSDVGWGCMLRSSQMLVAQAMLFHCLGRAWRKPLQKPFDREYIQILNLFGDSEASGFSIHNLLQAGKAYGLAAGSWVGPYAMCRSWETVARNNSERDDLENGNHSLPMAVYIVSGDEDGERGGAPVVCIDDAARHCTMFSKGQVDWTPILLLVPLVLGLEKVNPRYIPSLWATFTFPQSLGILGGKPGASTYIVGVQDDKAFYLDPHEVHLAVDIKRDNLEADTSSYHCNVIRHLPLDLIDPSLAIGFYCRDKDDFDDFCARASKLADESNGAPLFTVSKSQRLSKPCNHNNLWTNKLCDSGASQEDDTFDEQSSDMEACPREDDWQLL